MPPPSDDAVIDLVEPAKRRTQVLFKVTPQEKKKYVAASVRSEQNLSEWIRAALDREAERVE